MSKEKKTKIKSIKSKFFKVNYNGTTSTSPFEEPWKVFKRLSKEEIKITGKKFEDEPMAEISFTNPDDTKTTQMKIRLTKDMSKHELSEMIFAVGSTLSYIDNVCFIQILKSNLSKELEEALIARKFKEDETDHNYLVHEKLPAPIFTVYWLLGMSCGISIGQARGNMPIGMAIGMSIGMILGAIIDYEAKKNFNNLKKKRAEKISN